MLSADLKRLRATYDGWLSGQNKPDEASMLQLSRDLALCIANASLLELGVDPNRLDVVAASEEPGANIVLFPRRDAPRRPNLDGDAF
ncbi:hypothetical protein X566_01415 [Afipia sp. P52-10]|uniref:hypothetical protein n=1 Tax=Afipia sp. P52-10 TaxID=1429916 RepID=UPI0003DF02B8|nr:hypothetical protein [Afipia sp. P52-10]ETR79319.1 hypothetical protein X566_01415 [Afipia sp. P52-10]